MRIVSGHRRALLRRSLSRHDKAGVDGSPLALSLEKSSPIDPLSPDDRSIFLFPFST